MTRIATITGSIETVSRLADMGIFPGQAVQVVRPGLWKIDGQFTVAMRLTDTEIVLE